MSISKYQTLLNILDRIRSEATPRYEKKYNPASEIEAINQARSRAFIHLYLKVSFGLLEFEDREHFVTDGAYDGGIDGYYINNENKTIYFIQSKFRTTEDNFENKKIELEEILRMDINRILEGEANDEQGNDYSGKIKQLQREISTLDNIARYSYRVIIIANLFGIQESKLRTLCGGYAVEVLNCDKCYEQLVFPVISGTYFNASDMNIFIDLSNKSAGSKISYNVQTKNNECEITVLFVPTLEIGRIMSKYKNSILKFNPRSYLELEGQKVNEAIKETILSKDTNEFALFNNGITMLSDETYINEKIGQKNKAQLSIKNPQIINGGQTAFTLSRIFDKHKNNNVEQIFHNKEVLLKVITLIGSKGRVDTISLIDEISIATNQQTPVIIADRFSNSDIHATIQKCLFERYGILYERKRGEFGDGLYNQYVHSEQIIERNLFFRIYYSANGDINKGIQKKLFIRQDFTLETLKQVDKFDNFYFGFLCFKELIKGRRPFEKMQKDIYGMVYAMTKMYKPTTVEQYESAIAGSLPEFKSLWKVFISSTGANNKKYYRTFIDRETRQPRSAFSENRWYKSKDFQPNVRKYFDNPTAHCSKLNDSSDTCSSSDTTIEKTV
ncbi:MAG: AIPR family protein [Ignavibacteriales bacterium]|nr:AIPR family protein [Ignavibacteriales bacterium]